MNRITTLLLDYPKEFMNFVNGIVYNKFDLVDEFVHQMLKENHTERSEHQYKYYVLYDKDVGNGYVETATSIISSDINPLSVEGINFVLNTLYDKVESKKIVIRNIIMLEE